MEEQLNTDKYYNTDPVIDQSKGGGGDFYSTLNPTDLQSNGVNSNNSSGNFGAAAAAATAESEQMKIFVTNPNVTYHTRHARRIYVGGIPPNYSDEEELRSFFNKVISKGLEVENDNSYVISVYMNQKKCYAFVEFNSIELTTACLEMDGIIFKKVTLKIYRANEYRPELVPPTKFVKLDLSGWGFGLATGAGAAGGPNSTGMMNNNVFMGRAGSINGNNGNSNGNGGNNSGMIAPHASWIMDDSSSPTTYQVETIASLIQFTNIANMEPGSLAIVGFPYESNANANAAQLSKSPAGPQTRNSPRGVGTALSPTTLRKCLATQGYGAIYNAELGLDLSQQPLVDVGDVLAGQSRAETKGLLSTTVSELLLRGSTPFVVGGSRDQTFFSAMGLVGAAGVCVGVMNVSAQIDTKILDCSEFCAPPNQLSPTQQRNNNNNSPVPTRGQNCFGRYVQFGAQGSQCSGEAAKTISDRGGHIFWLHKDLRAASTESVAVVQFTRALRNLDACVMHDQQRKGVNTAAMRASFPQAHMMVTVDCGVLASAFNPHGGSSLSAVGLTAEELLEMAFLSGQHPNVALFEVTEFRPDVESESRLNMFLADMFYKFALGVASRSQPMRGGALGAGAAVLGCPTQPTQGLSSANVSPNQAQYNRTAVVPQNNNTANKQRVPSPYATSDASAPRYIPSRDPAVMLMQQQQQQQMGRGTAYTPQQMLVQQQVAQHQMARSSQRGLTPFPTIPENLAVNQLGSNSNSSGNLRPQLKHFTNPAGNATFQVQSQGQGQHEDEQDRQQRNSLGSFGGEEDSLGGGSYGSAMLSRSSNQQPHRHEAVNFQPNNQNMRHNGAPGGNNGSSNAANGAGNANSNAFYQAGMQLQQQQQSPPTANPSLTPSMQQLNLANTPSPWMYSPSSYNGTTPTSNGTASQPYTGSSDWLNPNLSRLSSHSTSTMSMLGAFHSTSSNLHTNSFSNNNGHNNSNNASFLVAPAAYDDPMDKLLGVTNIGVVPAFDDPQDPLYGED